MTQPKHDLDQIVFNETELDSYRISPLAYRIFSDIFYEQIIRERSHKRQKRALTQKMIQRFKLILDHLNTNGGIVWTLDGFNLTDNFQAVYDKMVETKMINSSSIKCFERRASILGYKHRGNIYFK